MKKFIGLCSTGWLEA